MEPSSVLCSSPRLAPPEGGASGQEGRIGIGDFVLNEGERMDGKGINRGLTPITSIVTFFDETVII
jgi:hypothetical protein